MDENYSILVTICELGHTDVLLAYQQLRNLLDRLCKENIDDRNLQMTDMAARISFIATKLQLTVYEQNCLHAVRITSNYVLNHKKKGIFNELLRDTKTIALFVENLTGNIIPDVLQNLLPKSDAALVRKKEEKDFLSYMRVCFQYSDADYLYVIRLDESDTNLLKVDRKTEDLQETFGETCNILWRHAQLNLLDVHINKDGILMPDFIVLEPDYLFNISSLAECYKSYGSHPANYLLSRLSIPMDSRALLLGNITNLFLDDLINNDEATYQNSMKRAFRVYPLEIFSCEDLRNKDSEAVFFRDCKMHFEHIQEIVKETFRKPGYDLDKKDAIVEPSFFCEALGLQGRLDYMQRDMSAFIEMKSGKADEFSMRGKVIPYENNLVQMLLYHAVLHYSMQQDHHKVRAFLLYTRYPLLYPAHSLWKKVKQAINLRNRIVANEYGVQFHHDNSFTALLLDQITASVLNERKLSGKFWIALRKDIDSFQHGMEELSALEKQYFYTVYRFITTELYVSKSGDGDVHYEGRRGAAGLWLNTLEEKKDSGEILYDLLLVKNDGRHLLFRISELPLLPNFRIGDAVVLYRRDRLDDNVTNKQILKASIEYMDGEQVQLILRNPQYIFSRLSVGGRYAIEHDVMDTSFNMMYHGLSSFLNASQSRRDLLLTVRPPQSDGSLIVSSYVDDFERVAQKALAAKDYFLLMGPPGTGKTSHALKRMVELFLSSSSNSHILLMAYTNRAVDEICKAMTNIEGQPDYLRIGNEISCEQCYRSHLLSNRMEAFSKRSEAMLALDSIRVFVGTIASLSDKDALFKLKHFEVAIIDEASQVLEPQLLNMLCARNPSGVDVVGKFVMIGDYKQLPAVVMQRKEQSNVDDPLLSAIGLHNLNESLFERLYRYVAHTPSDLWHSYDILVRQGRMNPDVASFSNLTFYDNQLVSMGLPHQCDSLVLSSSFVADNYSSLMLKRVAFIPSMPESWKHSAKTNESEAFICAYLAGKVYEQYRSSFDSKYTLGIITPYRNQIVMIKRAIAALNIEALNHICVDTVERFQGSERDVIFYSFCVNHPYQLKLLSNQTEDNGVLIDRKLNVALTRARKQMFLMGVPALLKQNPIYDKLLSTIPFFRLLDVDNINIQY